MINEGKKLNYMYSYHLTFCFLIDQLAQRSQVRTSLSTYAWAQGYSYIPYSQVLISVAGLADLCEVLVHQDPSYSGLQQGPKKSQLLTIVSIIKYPPKKSNTPKKQIQSVEEETCKYLCNTVLGLGSNENLLMVRTVRTT